MKTSKGIFAVMVAIATASPASSAAVLLDINADGTNQTASVADFEDAIGLSSGALSGSTVTNYDLGGISHTDPPSNVFDDTQDSIRLQVSSYSGDADEWFGGATSDNFLLDDGLYIRNSAAVPSATITVSGTGLGLLANTTYDLYLFAARSLGHTTRFTFDVTDPLDPSGGTTLTAGTPVIGGDETLGTVQFTFTTGATAPGSLAITWEGDQFTGGTEDAAFAGLALNVVPEPSSTALIGLGGLAFILRRRR